MPAKGDARPERQSSWANQAHEVVRYARLAFAAFVLLHLTGQAYRAATDGAIPEPGIELQPWLVASLLLVVWLPFLACAPLELRSSLASARSTQRGNARALAVVEPLALAVVVLFAVVHGVAQAFPLLAGTRVAGDLRPELVATLSGTERGVPVQAALHLAAVGAASFYAVRQTMKVWPAASPGFARAVVAGGVVAYLLGSYAVIRCASGALLP